MQKITFHYFISRRRRLQEARAELHADARGYHGTTEDYYRKQQELTEFDYKEDTITQQGGRAIPDDYKVAEYNRQTFPSNFPPPPKNQHHVYESPKFT